MVLTKAVNFDIRDYNHMIAFFVKYGRFQNLPGILLITAGKKLKRLCRPIRGFKQSLTVWIFADLFEKAEEFLFHVSAF
jgi:hypothetical protein